MVADMPAVLLVTTPAEDTETAGSLLDHEPPGVASASVVVIPVHTAVGPVIVAGIGLTVTACVAGGHEGIV